MLAIDIETLARGNADFRREASAVRLGQAVLVPSGTRHNVRNPSESTLRLWTDYAPPEHAPGTVHRTRAEADAAEDTH